VKERGRVCVRERGREGRERERESKNHACSLSFSSFVFLFTVSPQSFAIFDTTNAKRAIRFTML
jgi:hypothetical protein